MRKSTRRLIFYTAVVAFFLITILVATYATGYWYDFENRQWVKTGAVFVSANTQADFYLNDEFSEQTSLLGGQLLLNRLVPDNYVISLVKSNYQAWQKQIDIKAGEVASFSDILLVPINPEFASSSSGIRFTSTTPTGDRLLLLTDSAVVLFDLEDNQPALAIPFAAAVLDSAKLRAIWESNGTAVVLADGETTLQINFDNRTVSPLNSTSANIISRAMLFNNQAYYLEGSALRRHDLTSRLTATLINNVKSFWLDRSGSIFYSDTLKHQLWQADAQGGARQLLSSDILASDETIKSLANYADGRLLLTNKKLYRLHDGALTILAEGVSHYAISPNERVLAWHTTHEVWQLWLKNNDQQPYRLAGERELLQSTPDIIRNIYWHTDSRALITEQLTGGKVIESDTRGGVNIFTLVPLDFKSRLWYDTDGNYVYRLANGALTNWKFR